MGLNVRDCEVGTIVDHAFDIREDGKVINREVIRRGIIVEAEGNGSDSVSKLYVKFAKDAEKEEMSGAQLVRAYPASHRIAKEAYRQVMGQPKQVGLQFGPQRRRLSRRVEDKLGVTRPLRTGTVVEENYEAALEKMDTPDSSKPASITDAVVPETEETTAEA